MLFTWNYLKGLLRKDEAPDYSGTAMIAWPVIYTGEFPPRDPHVTLFFFPDVTENPEWLVMMKNAIRAVPGWNVQPVVEVKSLSLFGPDKDVPVLEVENPFLELFFDVLRAELDKRALPYDDTYVNEYKSHITISKEAYASGQWPNAFLLEKPAVWWRGVRVDVEPLT